jgi:hypothetical protein
MDLINCPNKVNHVSAFPASDRMLCPHGCGTYVRKVEGQVPHTNSHDPEPRVPRPKAQEAAKRIQENESGLYGEKVRYLVTINDSGYWTFRLAKNQGGGFLARDKELSVCLQIAMKKLEDDARTEKS